MPGTRYCAPHHNDFRLTRPDSRHCPGKEEHWMLAGASARHPLHPIRADREGRSICEVACPVVLEYLTRCRSLDASLHRYPPQTSALHESIGVDSMRDRDPCQMSLNVAQ